MAMGLLSCAGSADKGEGPVPGARVRFAVLERFALPCRDFLVSVLTYLAVQVDVLKRVKHQAA